ncbi:MAG TPA: hypothetical protein VL325_03225 [Pyrinomonadaceae bacterium]|nr:hypothetical protein [Pyrinomonadaceae bacterium]
MYKILDNLCNIAQNIAGRKSGQPIFENLRVFLFMGNCSEIAKSVSE